MFEKVKTIFFMIVLGLIGLSLGYVIGFYVASQFEKYFFNKTLFYLFTFIPFGLFTVFFISPKENQYLCILTKTNNSFSPFAFMMGVGFGLAVLDAIKGVTH